MTDVAAPLAAGMDLDIAAVANLFAEPSRARVLMALGDGRALPASVLAAEAGVSPQAVSAQLARLRAAGLLTVERSGRHRYYALASGQVAAVLEALAQLAPSEPVRSLRQSTRAGALRSARSCYDHLAGRLGVRVTAALLRHGALVANDGVPDTHRRSGDRLSSRVSGHPYALGPSADSIFPRLGVAAERLAERCDGTRRPLLGFCVDWSEQRHHLAGRLGADLFDGFLRDGWIQQLPRSRAIRLTDAGRAALSERLGLEVPDAAPGTREY